MTDPAAALQSLSPEQKQAVIMQVQQQANQQVMQEMMKNMATTCFEACAGTSVRSCKGTQRVLAGAVLAIRKKQIYSTAFAAWMHRFILTVNMLLA
jgi:hypothetical protein